MLKQPMKRNPLGKSQKKVAKSFFRNFVLCLCIILLASCSQQSNDPSWIAIELSYAFVTADIDKAKSITVAEQWDRIEEWMIGRESFECQIEEWEDETMSDVGGYRDAGDEWVSSVVYQCANHHTPYCLRINDVRLRKTKDGWKIYDWGPICEAFDYSDRCEELCGKR